MSTTQTATPEELYAAAAQNFTEGSAAASDDWFPVENVADGKVLLNVVVQKVRPPTTTTKNGKSQSVLNVPLKIVDGPLEGKVFDFSAWSNNKVGMSRLKKLGTILNEGKKPSDSELLTIVGTKAEGKAFQVACWRDPAGTEGKEPFKNVSFEKQLLPT